MKPLHPLSFGQASRCEHAKTPAARCRCRCGGKFHGSGRVEEDERMAFEALPNDDPHHVNEPKQRKLFDLPKDLHA